MRGAAFALIVAVLAVMAARTGVFHRLGQAAGGSLVFHP